MRSVDPDDALPARLPFTCNSSVIRFQAVYCCPDVVLTAPVFTDTPTYTTLLPGAPAYCTSLNILVVLLPPVPVARHWHSHLPWYFTCRCYLFCSIHGLPEVTLCCCLLKSWMAC